MGRLSHFRPAASVLLGLSVLGQAAFLLTANVAVLPDLAPALPDPLRHLDMSGPLTAARQAAQSLTRPWADLTGQWQAWALFAPDVADHVPFVNLELRWRDRPPWRLASLNEPADPHHFFRLGNFRLRRVESALEVYPQQGQAFVPSDPAWRAALNRQVPARQADMIAYLRWRLIAFRREHPDQPPPAEVIVSMHLYRIPAPPGPEPWDWEDLGRHPVARWRPGAADVEVYDPRTDDFGAAPERGG